MQDWAANKLEIWRSGEWLSQAPAIFTDVRAKRRKQARNVTGAWRTWMEREPDRAAEIKKMADGLNDAAARLSHSADLWQQRRGEFLARIYAGELVGLGFRPDTPAGHHPEEIPLQLFDDRFLKWSKCEIVSEYFHFVQVKIAEVPGSLPQLRAQVPDSRGSGATAIKPLAVFEKRKPGPNPVGDELRRIYGLLKADHTIPVAHTSKEAWGFVIAHINSDTYKKDPQRIKFKNERGLSYPTFNRETNKDSKD